MMVYRIIKGSLKDPISLIFYVEYVFLRDIGSAGYTEFNNDTGDAMYLYDEFPKAEDMRIGMIHSHHNMGTSFSGTDIDELISNSEDHLYYLSMIVSHRPVYSAKLVFRATENYNTATTIELEDGTQHVFNDKTSNTVLYSYNFFVTVEKDNLLENRIDAVRAIVKSRETAMPSYNNNDNRFLPRSYAGNDIPVSNTRNWRLPINSNNNSFDYSIYPKDKLTSSQCSKILKLVVSGFENQPSIINDLEELIMSPSSVAQRVTLIMRIPDVMDRLNIILDDVNPNIRLAVSYIALEVGINRYLSNANNNKYTDILNNIKSIYLREVINGQFN